MVGGVVHWSSISSCWARRLCRGSWDDIVDVV